MRPERDHNDFEVMEKKLMHIFRVDEYRVVLEEEEGYITDVRCTCEEADSVIVDPLISSTSERRGHCSHTAAATIHIYSQLSSEIDYEIERID